MRSTKKGSEVKTSERARAVGLRRVARQHVTAPGDEVTLADCKVRVTICLDADVLEYFKARAGLPNSAPYQTQINSELRAVMERGGGPFASLVNDDVFIAAVAERVLKRPRPRS
ncbi:MAG: BrnA antitoxin family protein [Acidobacteria bacterium]|nr:BrnA antitoxin family protein [Acidobacteriota bacterium]